MLRSNPCALCGSEWHTKAFCPQKPRTPIKQTKRLKTAGKRAKANKDTNSIWLQNNPPVDGYWSCYLRISPECLGRVTIEHLNIEHGYSKARRPDLRDDQRNLHPACHPCNKLKGSKNITDYVDKFPHLEKYLLQLPEISV